MVTPTLELVTVSVVAVNVAVVAPALTVRLAGTVAAAVLLLVSVTTTPPVGAAAFNVTVPVALARPPMTVVGFSDTERSIGLTVRVAVLLTPPCAAVIVMVLFAVTTVVVTANVADEAPAATVTLAGTEATAGVALDSVTAEPPAGAGPFRLTVPVEPLPPVTDVGFKETESSRGLTVSVAVFVTPA